MKMTTGIRNVINFEVTGCPKCCDKPSIGLCPKHKLEYLKWCAETAQNEYMEELRLQSRKKETK